MASDVDYCGILQHGRDAGDTDGLRREVPDAAGRVEVHLHVHEHLGEGEPAASVDPPHDR